MIERPVKLAFIGLISAFSMSVSAISIGSNDSIEDFEQFDWKGASYEEVQSEFSDYSSFMRFTKSEDVYRLKEKWLVNFIHQSHPGMKDYWNDVYRFDSMRIVHADRIIDLERNIVDQARMGARMHPTSAQYSPRISDGAEYPELKTSLARMKSGLAPIGPDNKPILLCRLNDDPRASYFEVSQTEAWKLLNVLGTGMTLTQACLSESVIPYYWKERAENLFNVRKNIIRSKRTDIK